MDQTDPASASRDAIVVQLFELFRRGGFDGVSLSDISTATGLGRSSLYHHFPGGKSDMAAAVLELAGGWLDKAVIAPLEESGSRRARIARRWWRIRARSGSPACSRRWRSSRRCAQVAPPNA